MASKQSQQEFEESLAQSQQQHQATCKHISCTQSVVYKWNESAKKCLRVAVQPQYQFVAIGLLQFLIGQFPILGQFTMAVAKSTGGLQSVLQKVLTVQACQLLWIGCQCLNSIRKECTKSAITSQVCATRANNDEWRQCLQFGSQWHGTSLQGAYSLWQHQSLSVPACPANQWKNVESGQPMLPSDAHWAARDISSLKLEQIAVESRLTEYHELAAHHEEGVAQYDQDELQLIRQADELYRQFIEEYAEFVASGADEQKTKLQKLTSMLDQVDKAFYSKSKK